MTKAVLGSIDVHYGYAGSRKCGGSRVSKDVGPGDGIWG